MVEQTVVTLGAHVLDVQVRPVEAIPEGQGAALVEQIRFGPAGTAAGTAVTLAKLGATVRTAGAVGADRIGGLLLSMLADHGVDTSLVLRREDAQTSTSVLPIRPDGSRPAFHVPGANFAYTSDDAPYGDIERATHLHLGGPELMGVPAFAVDVVDTTGCGDAFSAGFLRGVGLGRSLPDAARLGCAAAALVAQGLGSDHGEFDLAAADAFARTAAELPVE
jgi:sugar/nucleoside kinase (ribokinase family)